MKSNKMSFNTKRNACKYMKNSLYNKCICSSQILVNPWSALVHIYITNVIVEWITLSQKDFKLLHYSATLNGCRWWNPALRYSSLILQIIHQTNAISIRTTIPMAAFQINSHAYLCKITHHLAYMVPIRMSLYTSLCTYVHTSYIHMYILHPL